MPKFVKGQSGNPGGRPRSAGLAAVIRAETREGAELVEFMLGILRMTEGRIPLPVRMDAATWLADRGFGKPVQATEVTGAEGAPLDLRLREVVIHLPPDRSEASDGGRDG